MDLFIMRLKEFRKKNKLTQEDMARILDISLSAYRRYEYGEREPGVFLVSKMADYFGVTIDYLVGRTDA